jgi:hypothetical protein
LEVLAGFCGRSYDLISAKKLLESFASNSRQQIFTKTYREKFDIHP